MSNRLLTQSVGDALVLALREQILSEHLVAGQRITEAQVASDYDVARQTAKTAIERLVAEGLLERTAHRSAQVPTLSIARVRHLYAARRFYESHCYGMLAEQRNLPSPAVAAHEDFTRSAAQADLVRLVEADVRLHRELIGALANPYIDRAHSLLINETRLCLAQVQHRHLLDPTIIAEEHSLILHAIRTGNPDHARRYGTEHLTNAETRLVDYLASNLPENS